MRASPFSRTRVTVGVLGAIAALAAHYLDGSGEARRRAYACLRMKATRVGAGGLTVVTADSRASEGTLLHEWAVPETLIGPLAYVTAPARPRPRTASRSWTKSSGTSAMASAR